MKITSLLFGLLFIATEVHAQDSCVLVRRLAQNLGCSGWSTSETTTEKTNDDFVVSENFNSESCLTGKSLDDFKVTQKQECNKWLGDKRKELGKKFLTGNCVQNCVPCDTATLYRCATIGSAHYRAK